MALFRKMQQYYRPELTFRSEERLLQHMPSGEWMCVCGGEGVI